MKYVTFNLRCDYNQDGANCFIYRKPLILRAIEQEKPDVIGFQEVLPHMAVWLKENLTEYCIVGCGREEKLDGEQMTVAFRKDHYQLIAMNTFWLSPTPLVPGSRYAVQSSCPRTCTEALLMELASGRVFRILNTHLDHEGAPARKLGLEQILRYAQGVQLFPEAPVILAGDFNAEPGSEELQVFADFPEYTCVTNEIGITYHGYMRDDPQQIDYIYLRGGIACEKAEKWTQSEKGVYLSDHYPVCAELE